jgi:hypothetical protein
MQQLEVVKLAHQSTEPWAELARELSTRCLIKQTNFGAR